MRLVLSFPSIVFPRFRPHIMIRMLRLVLYEGNRFTTFTYHLLIPKPLSVYLGGHVDQATSKELDALPSISPVSQSLTPHHTDPQLMRNLVQAIGFRLPPLTLGL